MPSNNYTKYLSEKGHTKNIQQLLLKKVISSFYRLIILELYIF